MDWKRYILIVCIFWTPLAGGKSVSPAEFKKLQEKIKNTQHLSVQFVQLVYSPLRKRTRKKKGKALFAKPAKFRWTVEEPENARQEFFFDGKSLIVFDPNEKTAIRWRGARFETKQFQRIAGLLLNSSTLLKFYDLKQADLNEKQQSLEATLSPKQKMDIQTVQTKVDLKRQFVEKVKITYEDGKVFRFVFKKPDRATLEANSFVFSVPPGVKLEEH